MSAEAQLRADEDFQKHQNKMPMDFSNLPF